MGTRKITIEDVLLSIHSFIDHLHCYEFQMTEEFIDFEFVEVGNTYSEYQCRLCGRSVIVNMEDRTEDALDTHKYDHCEKRADND